MLIFFLALIEDESDKLLFEHLYHTYSQSMFLCAKQILGNDEDAQDAVHDAFTTVVVNIKKYDFRNEPRNLLLTITRNAAVSIQRKQKHEVPVDRIEELLGIDRNVDIQKNYDMAEDYSRIQSILQSLPEEYSSLFIMRYDEGLTYKQISELTGISVNTAKKRMQRLREHIIRKLGQEQ